MFIKLKDIKGKTWLVNSETISSICEIGRGTSIRLNSDRVINVIAMIDEIANILPDVKTPTSRDCSDKM